MPRGYRCIILAVVGWLVLAASPPDNRTTRENQRGQQSAQQSLSDITASLKEANKSPQPDPGCEQGKDNRSSDLCAQWKAADAAEKSATWTRRTFWPALFGVVIGGLTLAAAAFAAWWAKRAAEETKRGAEEAKRSADTAVKNYEAFIKFESPMLDVDFVKLTVVWVNGKPQAIARFAIRNIGRSPAIIDGVSVEGDGDPKSYNRIIASGQKFELQEVFTFPVFEDRVTLGCVEFITAMAAGKKRLFLMGFAKSGDKWTGSIHPGDVLEEDDPEYADPFARNE
jgi:hypothetical protein